MAREDRAAVRALFSENVRETDEDFDAQLDLLFEADLDASAFWDRDDIQLQGSYRHDAGPPPSCRTPSRYATVAGTTGARSS